jgi:hypothetical protein
MWCLNREVSSQDYPFSTARNPNLPDDDEWIVLDVPGLR